MGDPRKIKSKYSSPSHPWQKNRIESESELIKKYALKNKKEIWKMTSMLKNFKNQAKKLSSLNTLQAEKERGLLLKKLISMGIVKGEDKIDNILILQTEDMMERRLQTMVMKKGFAKSMQQARQFITHGHIAVKGRTITSPSYIVLTAEEGAIAFNENSPLANPENPERIIAKKVKERKGDEEKVKKSE